MIHFFVAMLFSLVLPQVPATSPAEPLTVVQQITRGGVPVATVVTAVGLLAPVTLLGSDHLPQGQSDQVLTTSVEDPGHPGEPWVITTYRRTDESYPAFIKRHRDTVGAVRDTLNQGT